MAGRTATICWTCRRSSNSTCSWSASLRPVPGWTAVYRPILMPRGRGRNKRMVLQESYVVRDCPLYQPDPPRRMVDGLEDCS